MTSKRTAALVVAGVGFIAFILGFVVTSDLLGFVGALLLVVAAVLLVADLVLGRRDR